MTDDERAVVARIASLIRDRGVLPQQLRSDVDAAIATWDSEVPDPALLADVKAALWAYLEKKHGNTTTIADAHDRSVRAALCLTEPPGRHDQRDLVEWATEMLLDGEN